MAVVIKDLLPKPIVVDIGNGKLSLRGINAEETIKLLHEYKEPLSVFFGKTNLDFTMLVATAPKMVAEIIAMGGDAVGQEDDIKMMPLQAQVECLMAVWEQSVPNIKKLLASLAKASESLKVAQAQDVHRPPLSTSFPS